MKLFVWDFHGTLEKDNEHAVREISNAVLEKLGYKKLITKKLNLELYGHKWYEYFEHLYPKLSSEEHFRIQLECHKYEEQNPQIVRRYIKPNNHMINVLAKISQKHFQILISNMAEHALNMFMDSIGISKFFLPDRAFATNSHNFKSVKTKDEILKDYLIRKKFDDIVIIGDRPHDVGLREVAGGTSYLYAHPGKKFPKTNANYKIHDLREILKEL